MSTRETRTASLSASDATPTRSFPTRALLIGGAAGLVVAALAVLSLGGGEAQDSLSPTGGGSVLVLALPAFLAGVLSFLSPCTLPILPAYFAFTFQARRERVVLMTIAFFLGLATTMVLLDFWYGHSSWCGPEAARCGVYRLVGSSWVRTF